MAKYIPPHRRDTLQNVQVSDHALLRMNQRGIGIRTVKDAIQGTTQQDKDTTTYRTENSFCVLGFKDKVVTVMDNYRNTSFDLLNKSKNKEKILLEKVAQNNDHAMCELGDLYLDRKFDSFNVQKAYDLFFKAATKFKNSHAMCKLAELHNSNLLSSKNPELSIEWMTKAADRGNKYATAIMGQHFMQEYKKLPLGASIEEKQDISSKSMRYFEISAAKGSTRAMWHIAFIYQKGFFGEQDLSKAINIFIKAAKRGSPSALESLQDLVCSENIELGILEDILNHISPIVAKYSSQISVILGLKQMYGELGADKAKASIRGLAMLEAAARHRNEDALINLVELYKEGTDFIAMA